MEDIAEEALMLLEALGCRASGGRASSGFRVAVGSRAGGGADDGSWLEYFS